jgi:hypothetical protein
MKYAVNYVGAVGFGCRFGPRNPLTSYAFFLAKGNVFFVHLLY